MNMHNIVGLLTFYNIADILEKDCDDWELCTLSLALLNMVSSQSPAMIQWCWVVIVALQ